ncbi:hypothetical protein [Thermomonospora umbrina]|uniref:Uncharacterized protein n=1 Tax=Thermomonospora umbrina TaxID=111806 RepID=A0A3D9T3K8_9ACTN|nr:hypothetical protein [Thermomonospora umbrina]REE99835.1 hypothetical protein DFJ69_5352 [Thermomonospora umbrina]
MLAQKEITQVGTTTDAAAVGSLMVEPEAVISDAPVFSPSAVGVLLLLILLSPKEPKSK